MAVTVQFATGLRVTYPYANAFQAVDGGWGKILIVKDAQVGGFQLAIADRSPLIIAMVSPASSCVVEVQEPTVRVEMVPRMPLTAKGE